MKRQALVLCAILSIWMAVAPRAAADTPFSVDADRIYAGMGRPYAQGYAPTESGDTLTVVLPLQSDEAVGDITAALTPEDPAAAPYKLQQLTRKVSCGTYRFGGETVDAYLVTFKLKLYPSRINGEYPFSIDVAGRDAAGNALTARFDLEAAISGGRAVSEPLRVAVEGFHTAGGRLVAGESDTLRFTVKNLSAGLTMTDLEVRVSDASGEVLPQTADMLALGRVAAGGAVACEVPVMVTQKAAAQPHTIELTLAYGYAGDKRASESIKYTVDVRQPVRFAHGDAALPERVTQGDTPQISVNLMNMGKSQIRNALLTFDVPGLSSGGSVLAGTIEPGESKVASANLRVDDAALGEVVGEVRISYEDAYGETHELSLPLKTEVVKKVEPVFAAAAEPKPEEAKGSRILLYAACAVLAALLVTQGVLLRRKIRTLEERHL